MNEQSYNSAWSTFWWWVLGLIWVLLPMALMEGR